MFDANFDAIRDYCLRRLPADDVNDAVADVFTTVWRRLEAVPSGEHALPWLYGVARNTVANLRRGNRRRRRLSTRLNGLASSASGSVETQVVEREADRRALAALDTLNDTDREILLMKAWEGLSHAQIAEALGLTVGAVDARASRARKRLERKAASTMPSQERPRSSGRGSKR